MNAARLLAFALALTACAACRRQDYVTVKIRVPEMADEKAAEAVVKAIATDQPVPAKDIRTDVPSRTVTVTYDSMKTALKNIEFSVAEAGFSANEVPPHPGGVQQIPAQEQEP